MEDRLVRQPEKHSREDALSTCLSSYWFALSQLLMLFCCAYCDRSSVPDARVGFDCFQPYEKINSENLITLLWSYVQHIEAVIGCMWWLRLSCFCCCCWQILTSPPGFGDQVGGSCCRVFHHLLISWGCITYHKIEPIATDVVWSVCLLITVVRLAEVAEPIEVPFGLGLG